MPCSPSLPNNGLIHYLKTMQDTDHTFKRLYHWNAFDAALLLPYFAVMILLAIYGVHRYTLCYLYFKYRKNTIRHSAPSFRRTAARHRATAHLQ